MQTHWQDFLDYRSRVNRVQNLPQDVIDLKREGGER